MRGPVRPGPQAGREEAGELGEGLTCPGSSLRSLALLSPMALGCLLRSGDPSWAPVPRPTPGAAETREITPVID